MNLPPDVARGVAEALGTPITQAEAVGGGCIAEAARVQAGGQAYFLKYGTGAVVRTFEAEALGLQTLRAAESVLVIPAVVAQQTEDASGFLLLEWLEQTRATPAFWEHLGRGLAELHRHEGTAYGFAQDNFIGRTPQPNAWTQTWPAFFRTQRLEPQVALARAHGRWDRSWDPALQRLYQRLPDLLPEMPPRSLLHGDLWSGNKLPTTAGAAIIDPAVYYGHREADLAMTELFGGFDARFYDAYRAAWPLEPGYESRREIYNLYHLLNHLNLFGGGYAGSVARVLERFA